MADLTLSELMRRAEEVLQAMPQACFYFKYTCGKCSKRLGFDKPNTMYRRGKCDSCGHITEIKAGGFMLVIGSPAAAIAEGLQKMPRIRLPK